MRPLHTMIEMKTRDFEDNLRLKRKEFMEQRHDTSAKCVAELKVGTGGGCGEGGGVEAVAIMG